MFRTLICGAVALFALTVVTADLSAAPPRGRQMNHFRLNNVSRQGRQARHQTPVMRWNHINRNTHWNHRNIRGNNRNTRGNNHANFGRHNQGARHGRR